MAGRRPDRVSRWHTVRVFMRHDGNRRYWSTIHRDDGIVVLLPGFDRKYRVPHDLAHLVTEREFRLTDGVFGSIADGALFTNMRVISGRLRHDPRQRSQKVLRANGPGIGVAELLAAAVHGAVERREPGRVFEIASRGWASLRVDPFPYPATVLRA